MAKIGVRYPRACPYTITANPDGTETETLGVGRVIGKATSVNVTVNADAQYQYADDGVAESVTEFTGGSAAVGLNDLTPEAQAFLLGHTYEGGELIAKTEDNAPYVRLGFIGAHILNNVRLYRAIVYMRVKFAPPSSEYTTKGQTITFGDTTINGALMRNAGSEWKREKEFSTQAEAIAYLNDMLNMSTGTPAAFTATFEPANGETGVSIDVVPEITLTNIVDHGSASIINASTHTPVRVTKTLDASKKVIRLTPKAPLAPNTEYTIVTAELTDAYGQTLTGAAAASFTTEAE